MTKEQVIADAGAREEAAGASETKANDNEPGAGTDSGAGSETGAGSEHGAESGNGQAAGADQNAESVNGQAAGAEDQGGQAEQDQGGQDRRTASESTADGETDPGEKLEGAPADAEEDEQARLAEEARLYKDRLVRLAAEFDNYKKRTGREFTALVKNAGESLITELLPILDNIERALQAPQTSEETRSFAQGFEMIRQQFLEKLEKAGMKEIAAEGTSFDPTRHEAVMAVEDEEHPADTVINVVEKGYTLNEKVLRATKVIVTRAPAKAPDRTDKAGQAEQAKAPDRTDKAGQAEQAKAPRQAEQAEQDKHLTSDPSEDE